MNMITLTEHAAISYACGFTLFGSLAALIACQVGLRLQSRERREAKRWREKMQDLERSTEAYRQHCEREWLRALARRVRPE